VFLFTDYLPTLSVAHNIWRKILGLLMNNELERIRKEAVVAYYGIFLKELKKTTNNLSQGTLSSGSSEYEAEVPISRHDVWFQEVSVLFIYWISEQHNT
jgi:hypothetical protein